MAVRAHQQVAAEPGTQAERIDVEVRQVHQMDGIRQQQEIAVWFRVEPLPEPFSPLPAPFRTEHGYCSMGILDKAFVAAFARMRGGPAEARILANAATRAR